MPRVPEYTPNVSAIPDMQGRLAPVATGEAFGASIGRGLANLGAGVSKIGAALEAVRDLEDEARVREARNQYMRERDALMYDPQNGYMFTQGRNALDQRSSFVDNLRKLREKYAKELNPRQQQLFAQSVEPLEIDSERSAAVHAGSELKSYVVVGGKASAENFAIEALRNIDNPQMADKYLAAGLLEIRSLAEKTGLHGEALEQMEREYLSNYRVSAVSALLDKDPRQAKAYFDKYKDQVSPEKALELQSKIDVAAKQANAKDHAVRILSIGRNEQGGGGVAAAGRTIGHAGPTNARAFLQSISTKDKSHVDGLDETFAQNLAAMIQDAPPEIRKGLGIYSGYRSPERQAQLYQDALKKYGSPERARKWVAPPGRSNHNHGRAVDLAWNGQSLARAPKEVKDWVRKNAPKYGLHIPMSWEPWHIEPIAARNGSAVAQNSVTVTPRAMMPSLGQIEAELEKITDPEERDLARRQIYAHIENQNKVRDELEKQAKDELWRYIDAGMSPDQVPTEVRLAAGMSAVNSAWEYYEKMADGSRIVTDPDVYYELVRMYGDADRFDEFVDLDLRELRPFLSKEDYDEVVEWQRSALTDRRKAIETGSVYTEAMSQARSQLEAVGLTTTGKTGDEREAVAKLIRQFEMILQQDLMAWMKANDGRVPPYEEIQKIITKRLLPGVIKQERSIWNPLKTPWTQFSERQAFMFEAPFRPDGTEFEVRVNYEDIPADLRRVIEADLESELGRKPSREEIAARYAEFLLNQ